MRLFSKSPRSALEPSYQLLQIKLAEPDHGWDKVEALIADCWEAMRLERHSKLSGRLADHISLEVCAKASGASFYLWLPRNHRAIEKAVQRLYPKAILRQTVNDYSRPVKQGSVVCSTELDLKDTELLPIVGSSRYGDAERWPSIAKSLTKVNEGGEEFWLQILLRPISDKWKSRAARSLRLRRGSSLSDAQFRNAAEAKIMRPGFRVKIRLLCVGSDQRSARQKLEGLIAAFQQFNSFSTNGFKPKRLSLNPDHQLEYLARLFIDKGFILNSREIASIFRLSSGDDINTTSDQLTSRPKKVSQFERLLAQSEAKSSPKPSKSQVPLNRQPSTAKQKRQPKGLLLLANKVSTKKDVGKVATMKSQLSGDGSVEPATQAADDEVVIKLR